MILRRRVRAAQQRAGKLPAVPEGRVVEFSWPDGEPIQARWTADLEAALEKVYGGEERP